MRRLQAVGVTFLYISHHLEEIYEVCQVVTVLRDARRITTAPVAELPRRKLIEAMTGDVGLRTGERDLLLDTGEHPSAGRGSVHRPTADAPVVVQVDHLSSRHFRDVSLTIRAGEVVGLGGLAGSGSQQLAETLAGLHRPAAGRISILDRPLRLGDVPAALAAGVGCVPRDRYSQGFVPELSVADNVSMTISDRLGPLGFISHRARNAFTRRTIADLGITTEGPHQPVVGLSGGNQQKVVMGRALATDPAALVLINPTAGVDVQSKRALLSVVDRVRAQGRAVLIVSDQPEDLRACDRVLVMFNGSVTAEHASGWTDHDLVTSIEGVPAGHE
jgi:simple sugar transport system ATP-binding protein